jgi:FAD/FMN-containing dehydrogenase
MPLAGGIVLDLSGLNRILAHRPGWVRVEPGAKLIDMDDQLRPHGWEIRMHPSTKRTATIGGFVAGGSGGIGSIQWGGLREPGNIIAAKVMTVEAEPRIIELRGLDVQKINRAYGTNGIIVELEMPLAPAWPWIDVLIRYPDFEQCLRAAEALQLNDGIAKKLVTPIAWPIPRWFKAMAEHAKDGEHWLIAMISEPDLEAAKQVIAPFGGTVAIETPLAEGPGVTPLYEYTWNHTTLQLLKTDKTITYLQSLFPEGQVIAKTMELWARYGDEVIPHLEMIRFNGRPTASALQIVRFTTEERLWRIIAEHEAAGVRIANPHVFTLEDGSRHKRLDADRQLALKQDADPRGLLNPGKMRAFAG